MNVMFIRIEFSALGTVTGAFGYKRTSGDHPNRYISEFGQITEKSPGNLRRLKRKIISVSLCEHLSKNK